MDVIIRIKLNKNRNCTKIKNLKAKANFSKIMTCDMLSKTIETIEI